MIRMFLYFAVLLAAAFGVALLLETPGSVVLTYGGFEYRVTLAKAVAIMFIIAIALGLVWTLIRFLLRLPSVLALSNRLRKRQRGYTAISRGLVSVGVGDRRMASRYAQEAERHLGKDPMALLLKAQSAQLTGDRKAAETAFTRMLDNPETKVLGLRGLFIEARREGKQGARQFAEEAYRLAPSSPWAGQAVLEYRTAEKDWRGAMTAIDEAASRRVIDRDTGRRQKATLLAAQAMELADSAPESAYALANQALKLNSAHVQAARIASERLAAKGDYAKATRLLEQVWKVVQHPDIAEAYLSVRHGDSTFDRLKRAKTLLKLAPKSRESALVLTRAALDAREFSVARETLEPLVLDAPTARACRLMAELEDREHGDAGLVRKWLARASVAPRDPAWVADGFVSDTWAPVSPVTGRIDAYEWKTPPQSIASSVRAAIDADETFTVNSLPAPAETDQPSLQLGPEDAPAIEAIEPSAPASPEPITVAAAEPEVVASEAKTVADAGAPAALLAHAPDDPGPRTPQDDKNRRSAFGR